MNLSLLNTDEIAERNSIKHLFNHNFDNIVLDVADFRLENFKWANFCKWLS